MSLTSRLGRPEVRGLFAAKVRRPDWPAASVRVPVLAEDPARVGIAFDYALRYGLHAHGWAEEPETVAASAVALLVRRPALGGDAGHARHLLDEATTALLTMRPRELTPETARALFDLAGLDVVYRAHRTEQIGRVASPREVEDLAALFAIVPWDAFRPKACLALNPTFGEGSHAVGGADADLVIDNTVVEIKVVAQAAVQAETIRQLVGYALLARRYGVDVVEGPASVDRIGVYLARCGVLLTAALSEAIAPEDEDAVLETLLAAVE